MFSAFVAYLQTQRAFPQGTFNILIPRVLDSHAKTSVQAGAQDTTIYGSSRASPKKFYFHHLAAISAAIVRTPTRSRS